MNILKSYSLLRNYRKDPISYMQFLFRKNGHRSDLNVFGKKIIILSHPHDVLHVLKDNHTAYVKGRTTKAIKEFLGDGLITSDGEKWRKQHRLIRPMMNPKHVYVLAPKMHATTQEFMKTMEDGISINAFNSMNLLTWRIVLTTLFSQTSSPQLDSWLDDVVYLMESVTIRTRTILKLPSWIPTSRHRKVKRIVKNFSTFVEDLIKSRNGTNPHEDLLQLLIDAKDEDDSSSMTEKTIKDEVLTFLMAGHETITNTLTWTLISLAQNPHYLEKLRKEADEFIKSNDFQKLNEMPFHGAVIDESMRLWPPVWAFMRTAEVADEVPGLKIPAKSNIVLVPFLTHRAPDLWEKASQFYPERWINDKKKILPGMYYPFGLGPRACIGAYFAGMEAKIILANIVSRWDWKIDQPLPQTYEPGITLRPTNNIQMTFTKRK